MSYRSLLRHRGFLALWVSQVISGVGNRLGELAFIWIVFEITGDPILIALTVIAHTVPGAVLSIPAGIIVDRVNRKYLLSASQFVYAGAILAIPIFGRGPHLMPTVVIVGLIAGTLESVQGPARGALIPNLVPEQSLDAANGLSTLTTTALRTLYAVAGAVIVVFGAYNAFYIDSMTYVLSGLVLLAIPTQAGIPDDDDENDINSGFGKRAVADARDGFSYIRSEPILVYLTALLFLTTFAAGPLAIVLPMFSEAALDGSSLTFGLLYSGFYVGMMLGGLFITILTERFSHGSLIAWGTVFSGTSLAIVALVPSLGAWSVVASIVFMVVSGVATLTARIPSQTMLQTIVPDDKRGRVFGIISAGTLTIPMVSYALAGIALQSLTAAQLLLVIGIVSVAGGLGAMASPLNGFDVHSDQRPGRKATTND